MSTVKIPFDIQAVIPGNTPETVKDSKSSPFYFVGLLQMKFPNKKNYIGTATLVMPKSVEKKKTPFVLTCAHNLYDKRDGGEATEVSFVRGYNDPKKPYETIDASDWFYPKGYPDVAISRNESLEDKLQSEILANIELDYALVKLKTSVEVAGLPQMVVEKESQLENLDVQINGYGYFGEAMSHASGKIKEVGDTYLRYPISTKKGASGSAIMKDDDVSIVGIHTRAYSEKYNQGVRMTDSVVKQIEAWME